MEISGNLRKEINWILQMTTKPPPQKKNKHMDTHKKQNQKHLETLSGI
jgi:hypothetical protein